jgi:hypothetical protein
MDRTCSAYGKRGSVYSVLIGKPERKRLLGRPKLGWENNNKIIPDVKWGHKLD